MIISKAGKELNIWFLDQRENDPIKRKPLIDLAIKELDWEPKISLIDGLDITRNYFQKTLLK